LILVVPTHMAFRHSPLFNGQVSNKLFSLR